jgi:hypothetical protein
MFETFQIILFMIILLIFVYILVGRLIERFKVMLIPHRYTFCTNPVSA